MKIQEIAEELVNLNIKEINELSNVIQVYDMPQVSCHTEIIEQKSSPKEYGMKLYERKHKKRR